MRARFDEERVERHAEGARGRGPRQTFSPHFIHDEQQSRTRREILRGLA